MVKKSLKKRGRDRAKLRVAIKEQVQTNKALAATPGLTPVATPRPISSPKPSAYNAYDYVHSDLKRTLVTAGIVFALLIVVYIFLR